MPSASTFTIKDGAATPLDTVFTNVQPSGGNLPAVYIAKAKGPSGLAQPKLQISSNGSVKSREIKITLKVPSFVTVNGLTTVGDSAFAEVKIVLPESVPDSVRSDFSAYLRNSLDVAQISESTTSGYAPA